MRGLAVLLAVICSRALAEPVELFCVGGLESYPDNPDTPAEVTSRTFALTVDANMRELTIAGDRYRLVPSLDGSSYHGYLRGRGEWARRYVALDRDTMDISITFANDYAYETFSGSCKRADSQT